MISIERICVSQALSVLRTDILPHAPSSHYLGVNYLCEGVERRCLVFFFQAEDGIRDLTVTGVQTCALPISDARSRDVHTRNGPARARVAGRRRPRREGGGVGRRRLYVLHHRGRFGAGDRRRACRRRDSPPRAVGGRRGPRLVTTEELAARREQIAAAPDLAALLAHLTERAASLLARLPPVPESKALLSTDGGVCPEDGAALVFDPWSPNAHRCPRCG